MAGWEASEKLRETGALQPETFDDGCGKPSNLASVETIQVPNERRSDADLDQTDEDTLDVRR